MSFKVPGRELKGILFPMGVNRPVKKGMGKELGEAICLISMTRVRSEAKVLHTHCTTTLA